MPRYDLAMRDGEGLRPDDVGDEFDAFDEARAQARRLLPDVARDESPDGELHRVSCDTVSA